MSTKPIRKGVYVCFVGSQQTRATFHKAQAKRFVDTNPGAVAYGMSRQSWKDSGPYGWDGPTFRVCATQVYPVPA